MGMKFAPGGHSTFFAMLNAFVHIVMYFYYMIAAMGPEYQKYIWWKKYLTAFQMVCDEQTHDKITSILTNVFSSLLFTLTASVCRNLHTSVPTALGSRLRISQRIHGVDWTPWSHVSLPFLRLLQAELHREAKKTERDEEKRVKWKGSRQ